MYIYIYSWKDVSSPSSSVALLLQTDPLSHPKDQTCCGRPTGSDPPRKIPARSPGRCQEAWRLTSEGQSLEQIGIGLNTRVPNTPIICVTALGCLRVKYIYIYVPRLYKSICLGLGPENHHPVEWKQHGQIHGRSEENNVPVLILYSCMCSAKP